MNIKWFRMPNWSILGAVSILSSLGMFAPPAWAETKQIDFTLSSQSNQTFAVLMQQAKFLATSFIEQGFAESPGITEISVSILGERNGQQARLLFSTVSRSDWQRQPKIQEWTRYFGSSASLLGFKKPQVQQFASPASEGTFVQQSTPPTSEGNSVQQSTSSTSGSTSTQQSTSPLSAGTSTPTRARLEEDEPNYR